MVSRHNIDRTGKPAQDAANLLVEVETDPRGIKQVAAMKHGRRPMLFGRPSQFLQERKHFRRVIIQAAGRIPRL